MLAFVSDIFRLVRAGICLLRHGALFPRPYWTSLPGSIRFLGLVFARPSAAGAAGAEKRPGQKLATALEKLGPAYIKLGQLIATRPDIIGLQTAHDLSRLKDSLPPFPAKKAHAALLHDFGPAADSLFGVLNTPVAAASVAQVYRLDTPDGLRAVKILRPRIEEIMAREMRALARLAHVFAGNREAARLEPIAFVETLSAAMTKELDLHMEAAALDEFTESGEACFHIPRVDWKRTSRRVLSTEWVDGAPLTHPGSLAGTDRARIAVCITQGFLSAALNRGFFHADMHEGNMIVRPPHCDGPPLGLVDFGLTARIGIKERRFLAQTLHGFLKRDYESIAHVHFDAGYVPAHQTVGDFAQALRAVGESVFSQDTKQVRMGALLIQLFDVTRRFGMRLRPELVLLQKTMLQVEGVSRAVDPDHNIWRAASPVVDKWIAREFGPEGLARSAARTLADSARSVRRLPAVIAKLETRLDQTPAPPLRRRAMLYPGLMIWAALAAILALILHPPLADWLRRLISG